MNVSGAERVFHLALTARKALPIGDSHDLSIGEILSGESPPLVGMREKHSAAIGDEEGSLAEFAKRLLDHADVDVRERDVRDLAIGVLGEWNADREDRWLPFHGRVLKLDLTVLHTVVRKSLRLTDRDQIGVTLAKFFHRPRLHAFGDDRAVHLLHFDREKLLVAHELELGFSLDRGFFRRLRRVDSGDRRGCGLGRLRSFHEGTCIG